MNNENWRVGGSNDERHHWFLFRYLSGGDYEVRTEDGNGVLRYQGGYVIYPTKKAATEALKGLKS